LGEGDLLKSFIFKADVVIEGESLDEIFEQLAYHFHCLAHGIDQEACFEGEMTIKPTNGDENPSYVDKTTPV